MTFLLLTAAAALVAAVNSDPLVAAVDSQMLLTKSLDGVYASAGSEERRDALAALITAKAEAEKANNNNKTEAPALRYNFNCPTLAPRTKKAASVHDLRPSDIGITMAMGDSVTASFASAYSSIFSGIKEYKGNSWSIGGDAGAQTLPNFIKHYNPAVRGASTGTTGTRVQGPGLNAAVSGAIVQDMPSQVDWLKSELDKGYAGWKDEWKVITVFIGANNLCPACQGAARDQPDAYEQYTREFLSKLEADFPKTFVALVPVLNVTSLYDAGTGLYCSLLHMFECPCVNSAGDRETINRVNKEDHERIYKLEAEYKAKGLEDFAVAVQPFGIDSVIPSRDYLSKLDCFHPAVNAHQGFAVGLWNNLISKKAFKAHSWDPSVEIKCPTEDTLIYTD